MAVPRAHTPESDEAIDLMLEDSTVASDSEAADKKDAGDLGKRPVNMKKLRLLTQFYEPVKFGWIYLSPELEEQDDRVIVAVIAHELAHIIDGDILGVDSEKRADNLVRQWGFSAELDQLRASNPNQQY